MGQEAGLRVQESGMPEPRFFRTPSAFRTWLQKHHAVKTELWIGYYKKSSGKGGMVYAEALEQALCFGWIDGIVKSIDEATYMQRFSPRQKRSYWSAVNIKKVQALIERGLMAPAGLAAFEARPAAPPGRYSNENRDVTLEPAMIRRFKGSPAAWHWFEQQPASFRRLAAHWVTSAKKDETRAARLATLIESAGRGEKPPGFVIGTKKA
jgi:uncharacterized protein YdeI (YjbR/CyaY-like superfamily)